MLLGEFGYLAVGEDARKVLKDEYEPLPGMNQYTVKLLSFLKMHDKIKKHHQCQQSCKQKISSKDGGESGISPRQAHQDITSVTQKQ